jgi:hypothetical protein
LFINMELLFCNKFLLTFRMVASTLSARGNAAPPNRRTDVSGNHDDQSRRRRGTHGAGWLNGLLAVFQIGIGIIVVGVALWLVISLPLWWADAPRPMLPMAVAIDPTATDLLPAESVTGVLREVSVERIRGDLAVQFASPWAQWLYIFFGLQQVVIVYLVVSLLRKVVASAARGVALSRENAKRLRWVGLLFLLEAVYAPGVSSLLTGRLLDDVAVPDAKLLVDWGSDLGSHNFVTGWIVLVLSEVFRQGAELRDDQAYTV